MEVNFCTVKIKLNVMIFLHKILEENNWKDVEILCYDDSLQNLFSNKIRINYIKD